MARNENGKGAEKAKAARPPLRSILAALGVGLAWAALHMPDGMGGQMQQVTWILHAVVAALLAKCVLDLGGSLFAWTLKVLASLLNRIQR